MSFPRYFAPRSLETGATPEARELLSPAHAIDTFHLAPGKGGEGEWVVTVDSAGGLALLPGERRSALPAAIQSELAYHEMSVGPGRHLKADEFFLFSVRLVEQPAKAPGPNDPVYLYGTLYGPFPAGAESAAAAEGQLAVTRADVLEGLVQGAPYAFRYANPPGAGGPTPCCFQMILPGAREEELGAGSGFVLAYPLLPPELNSSNAANDLVVCQILYDLLSELRADVQADGVPNPVSSMVLPVPSRALLEGELRAKGYTVEGNTAVRRAPVSGGFSGFLASVFGALLRETLELPPEGKLEEFLEIARRAVAGMQGWPSPRALILRERVRHAATRKTLARQPSPGPPSPTPRVEPAPVTRQPQLRRPASKVPDWMRDFIDSHRQPDSPQPRLTSPAEVSGALSPDWIRDFPGSKKERRSRQKGKVIKPEWMKDFE